MKHHKPVSMFLAAVALCLVLGLVFPGGDPARAAKGGNKTGNSEDQKWPSTIVFTDTGKHLTGDGGDSSNAAKSPAIAVESSISSSNVSSIRSILPSPSLSRVVRAVIAGGVVSE